MIHFLHIFIHVIEGRVSDEVMSKCIFHENGVLKILLELIIDMVISLGQLLFKLQLN